MSQTWAGHHFHFKEKQCDSLICLCYLDVEFVFLGSWSAPAHLHRAGGLAVAHPLVNQTVSEASLILKAGMDYLL